MISKLNRQRRQRRAVISLLLIAMAGFGWNALAEPNKKKPGSSAATGNDSSMELSGERLWSNNCRRCHNLQPPTMYSPAQWSLIVHHMRVRANITGAEQRAITEFLKSSSH